MYGDGSTCRPRSSEKEPYRACRGEAKTRHWGHSIGQIKVDPGKITDLIENGKSD